MRRPGGKRDIGPRGNQVLNRAVGSAGRTLNFVRRDGGHRERRTRLRVALYDFDRGDGDRELSNEFMESTEELSIASDL